MKKLNIGIFLAAVTVGFYAVPAAADATAEAVWAELQVLDATLTEREMFNMHIDYSDEDGLTYYEVRALLHHLDETQVGAIEHACNHVLMVRTGHMEETYDFCHHLEDALADTPPEDEEDN